MKLPQAHQGQFAYVKSILASTKTRETKPPAKEATEGCWLYKTTVTYGDRASHDRTATSCLVPVEPTKGLGAVNMVILRLLESETAFLLSLEVLM